ncbi:MAG: DNA topoisomerase I [Candidatus Nanohaloarchaeota archaeon QJJ-7]|nr:DNA topoisomerase I [Candidatus Nanohaloarchaeota archaeon QJJ-7]
MTTLMVAEKPKVAQRLADALGDYEVEENRGVKNYRLDTEQGEVVIAPSVGHIFSLEQSDGEWTYPVFDVEWVPSFESEDGNSYMKKYFNNLKDQGEDADDYINACDFDLEGSVIGERAITLACNGSRSRTKRMKFSTLTTSDLQEAFDDLEEFDTGQTEAGLTRHLLDWYYGINISRALMLAVQSQDRFQKLSTGRVQGPTLKVLADREREIQAFDPDPYWEVVLRGGGLEAKHEEDRFWEEEEAEEVLSTCKGEKAVVASLDRNRYKHNPPVPFNLTGLQKEAQSQFGISPARTQEIAQSLYEDSLISYPRTESQKLPPKIGYKQILNKLKKQDDYEDKAGTVLDKNDLYTRQGGGEDPAHPAIHPTGIGPNSLSDDEENVYDLIVKRFFAVFGDAAVRETLNVSLDINSEIFKAKGKRTIERNWFSLYEPYVNVETIDLPDLDEGQELSVDELEKLDKETQPPNRYSQAGIVSELEKRNLGTKATRSQTVDRLYDRGYIDGAPIEVTDIGLTVVKALEEYSPDIVSEELTRQFEEKMQDIREEEMEREEVLQEARDTLSEILEGFQEKEDEIGEELVDAIDVQRKKERELGPCDQCEDGTLRIIKKNGKFVGCSNYPDCENTYPLTNGKIESTGEVCDTCHTPIVKVIRKGRRPFEMCLDPDCPTKDDWD